MAWTHNTKGTPSRSGKQHSYTGEGYDSWQGLSPNGRQYKNDLTGEVRNLSGADYWHARKAHIPDDMEEPPTWVDGKPNIKAFGIYDEVGKKGKSKQKDKPKKPELTDEQKLEYKVFPQQKTLDNIDSLMSELREKEDKLEPEAFLEQWEALEKKRDRAWALLCKAKGWNEGETKEEIVSHERVKKGRADYILDQGGVRLSEKIADWFFTAFYFLCMMIAIGWIFS